MTVTGGGHPRPPDGQHHPEPEHGPGTASGVSSAAEQDAEHVVVVDGQRFALPGGEPAGGVLGDSLDMSSGQPTADPVEAFVPADPAALRLAWVDLETTGLVPDVDRILEIGCLVTEHDLTPLDSGFSTVIHVPAADMPVMEPEVREMHERSGLLDEVAASVVTAQEARAAAMAYLRQYLPPGVAPVAGSSVRHDRKFLERYAPELEGFFHYRVVDVSSIKEITRRWFPHAYAGRPRGLNRHRSLHCIYDAITELRYYRDTVFVEAAATVRTARNALQGIADVDVDAGVNADA